MQTTSVSLGDLLRRAKDGSLTIPQFQRQFVWRDSQVKLLIDSISRSYPIGSLLLLNRNPDLLLASRSIEAEIRDGFPPDDIILADSETRSEVDSYILDGQQRTTSIARVFLNAHPRKLYYFDLKLLLESHDKEDLSWIRVRHRGKTEPDRKDNNRLLRADIVLDQSKADIYVSEYIEDSGDFPQFEKNRTEGRRAAAQIKGVFETMRNYKVPIVTLERNSGIESVCRVFETINSTGTRLTTFDLAVARFYPEPDLRSLWEDALDEHPILKEFDVDGERVLQVLYLMASASNESYPEPSRSQLLALTSEDINRGWSKSSRALAAAYKWARACGARPRTLPNHNVVVALAAAKSLFLDGSNGEIGQNHDLIRRWYFTKVLQAGSSQSSNYRIGQDFDSLRRYLRDGKELEMPEVNLNSDVILGLRPSDARYKALQNVFAMTVRQDMVSSENIDSESVLHDHHIFPSNAHKKHGLDKKMLDGICNRVPVLESSNLSLGEGYPEEYFGDMAHKARSQGTLEGLRIRLRDCMIPGDPGETKWHHDLSIEKFEDFCHNRAELIVKSVSGIVGDSLRNRALSDDEMAEDNDI